jgi:hypothetical protein
MILTLDLLTWCVFQAGVNHDFLVTVSNGYPEEIKGDQKVSVHLVITTQKVTSNVQSAPRQSPDIY